MVRLDSEDEDVARERRRIESGEVSDALCLKQLTKVV